MSDTVKALVTPNEWNWEAALEILADNWFDTEGARIVTLTEVETVTNDGRVMRFLHGPMEDVTDEYLAREGVQE